MSAVICSLLLGCENPNSTAHDVDIDQPLNDAARAELAPKAEHGDWTAARSLALDSFYSGRANDWLTLKWTRAWATGNPADGTNMLSLVLSRSCDLRDRDEAVALMRSRLASPDFANLSPDLQDGERGSLEIAIQARRQGPTPTCNNLAGPT
ncbi:MAG: hypothetical protein ABUS57_05270 [Pseudomonadota bacterium]